MKNLLFHSPERSELAARLVRVDECRRLDDVNRPANSSTLRANVILVRVRERMRACVRACELPLETKPRRRDAKRRLGWPVACLATSPLAGNGHPGPFKEDELDSKTGFQCGLKEAEAELKTGAIPFRRET